MRSSASPNIFQYTVFSLRSFSNCLGFLLRLPIPSILPSILSSIMCFRWQFLRKIVQSSNPYFHLFVWYSFPSRLYLITLHFFNTIVLIDLLHPSPAPHFKFSKVSDFTYVGLHFFLWLFWIRLLNFGYQIQFFILLRVKYISLSVSSSFTKQILDSMSTVRYF